MEMESQEVAPPPNEPRPSKNSPHRARHSRRASSRYIEVNLDQTPQSAPDESSSPRDSPMEPSDGRVNTLRLETSITLGVSTAEMQDLKGNPTAVAPTVSQATLSTTRTSGLEPLSPHAIDTTSNQAECRGTMSSFLQGIRLQRVFERDRMILIGVDPNLVIEATNDFTATIMGVKTHTRFGDLKADPYVADHIVMLELMIQECLRGNPVEGVLMRMELSEEVHLNYLMDVCPQYNDSNTVSGVLICGRNMDEIFKNAGANHLLKAVTDKTPPPNLIATATPPSNPAYPGSPTLLGTQARQSVISIDNIFQKKLIRTLSHDVRAPFKVILSGLKFLETELYDKLTFPQSDLIQDLKQSCKDTACILQNIITFEKHTNQILTPAEFSSVPCSR